MTGYAYPNPEEPSRDVAPAVSEGPIGVRHLQVMVAVMLAALIYVTYVTQFSSKIAQDTSPSVMTQQLVFKDDANGDILIEILQASRQAGQQGESVLRFSGEQGFLRGTLRALARERKSRHLSPEAPFELALHQDGRLSITDTLTHQGIDLEAFGPDNLAVFVAILHGSSQTAAQTTAPTQRSLSQTDISKENQ
jgi:putative photosynthetic complex assembly protein